LAKAYFVAGLAGSGKSYYSRKIAKELDLKIIDFDDNFNEFIKAHKDEYEALGSEKFLANYASTRYTDLINRSVIELEKNVSVVIAAPFSKQLQDQTLWDELTLPIKKFDSNPTLYWVVISDELRKKRLITRGEMRDAEKINKIDEYIKFSPAKTPVVEHVLVQGDKGYEGQFRGNV
jgi:dephospho-CoA kinase